MAKSMSIKLEFVAPLPQIAITRFTYNTVEFYGPQGPRYKEVDRYHTHTRSRAEDLTLNQLFIPHTHTHTFDKARYAVMQELLFNKK